MYVCKPPRVYLREALAKLARVWGPETRAALLLETGAQLELSGNVSMLGGPIPS
jgi:hypothetical protein